MKKFIKVVLCLIALFGLNLLTSCKTAHNRILDMRYEMVNLEVLNGFEITKIKNQIPVIKGSVSMRYDYIDMEDYVSVSDGVEMYIVLGLEDKEYSNTTRRYIYEKYNEFYLIASYLDQFKVAYKVEITKDASIKEYDYYFDVDGRTYDYGRLTSGVFVSEPTKDESLRKEGYEFLGWGLSYDSKEIVTFPYLLSESTTFYAIYQENEYCINYHLDGGSFTDEVEYTYLYNQDIYLSSPKKDNYIFEGWYLDSNFTEKIESIEPGTIEEVNIYAKWTKQGAIFREGNKKYMYLGYYPQTVVDNNTIIKELTKLTITNELGYYEYKGEQYIKAVAKPRDDGYIFLNNKKVIKDGHYYFKVEPIKWRVISENENSYELLSEYILDAKAFYKDEEIRTINGKKIYPNNYEHSDIRTWLNNGFYNMAFTNAEKNKIVYTDVDNSFSTTDDASVQNICNNTKDKVYLLSYKDLVNPEYGFNDYYNAADNARKAIVTDYACANGCYKSSNGALYLYGVWFLRSPCNLDYIVSMVSADGGVGVASVSDSKYGVRPTIKVSK